VIRGCLVNELNGTIMRRQISGDQLFEAYLKGDLGAAESYGVWTPLWALRSKIWRKKGERKVAVEALGEVVMEAIDEAEVEDLEHLAAALKTMLEAERSPAFAVMADVFFAVEQLNCLAGVFTKSDVLWWLNKKMEAVLTGPEVEGALEAMELAELIPDGKRTVK